MTVQFYAYTPPTMPPPDTTPYLQAFKENDDSIRIVVRDRSGAVSEITLSVQEASRFSSLLAYRQFMAHGSPIVFSAAMTARASL